MLFVIKKIKSIINLIFLFSVGLKKMEKKLLIILTSLISISSVMSSSCNVSNCKTCYYSNSLFITIIILFFTIRSKCSVCDSGYYKSYSYKCYSCPTGCKTCSSYSYCTSCYSSYTLSSGDCVVRKI